MGTGSAAACPPLVFIRGRFGSGSKHTGGATFVTREGKWKGTPFDSPQGPAVTIFADFTNSPSPSGRGGKAAIQALGNFAGGKTTPVNATLMERAG